MLTAHARKPVKHHFSIMAETAERDKLFSAVGQLAARCLILESRPRFIGLCRPAASPPAAVGEKNLKKDWVEGLTIFQTMHKMRATCSEQCSARSQG